MHAIIVKQQVPQQVRQQVQQQVKQQVLTTPLTPSLAQPHSTLKVNNVVINGSSAPELRCVRSCLYGHRSSVRP